MKFALERTIAVIWSGVTTTWKALEMSSATSEQLGQSLAAPLGDCEDAKLLGRRTLESDGRAACILPAFGFFCGLGFPIDAVCGSSSLHCDDAENSNRNSGQFPGFLSRDFYPLFGILEKFLPES